MKNKYFFVSAIVLTGLTISYLMVSSIEAEVETLSGIEIVKASPKEKSFVDSYLKPKIAALNHNQDNPTPEISTTDKKVTTVKSIESEATKKYFGLDINGSEEDRALAQTLLLQAVEKSEWNYGNLDIEAVIRQAKPAQLENLLAMVSDGIANGEVSFAELLQN